MSATVFLEPLDVLLLRGNKLFGDPGSYGEALVPPWPSVAAGALRSRMLVDAGIDPLAFARGEASHEALGTPSRPGPFVLTAFHVARRYANGRVEVLVSPPADLVIGEEGKLLMVKALRPSVPAKGLQSSAPMARLAVLPEPRRSKPAGGYWLKESGWRKYLRGGLPAAGDLVKSDALWRLEHRVGVGLDVTRRRAAEGRLFSLQAIATIKRGHVLRQDDGSAVAADYDVGFVASVAGITPPCSGLVRLGGDGRAAALHPVAASLPEPDYDAIARAGRCRLVLTTPGIFTQGWLPPACKPQGDGSYLFELAGVRARLVCAAVPRFEVVSGWDLANWQPKAAQRAAPAGSVYWLEDVEATPEALRKLAAQGLWGEACEDALRRAEGFNRITFAAY